MNETRLKPYFHKNWIVHHYVEGNEQFIACQGPKVLRAHNSKTEIERLIDTIPTKRQKTNETRS